MVTMAIPMAPKSTTVEEGVRRRLEFLGLKRRKGGVFTIEVAPGILGWLGLNAGTKGLEAGQVEINPVIGVRFEDVERLFDACRPDDSPRHVTPTISSPLGYLLPEKKFKTWLLGPGADPRATEDMVRAIVEYGVPFMRSVPDLRTLRQKIDQRTGIEDVLVYKRPLAAYLDGEPERAREILDATLASSSKNTDLAAEYFREFAKRFRERLAASPNAAG